MKQVILAEKAGFCYGVKRAIELTKKVDSPAFTLGELIHNPQMVAKLEQQGITCAQNLSEVPEGSTLIIRAHGVSDQVLEQAKQKKLQIVNATCPFVSKVHVLAKKLETEGWQPVLLGEKGHPEVIGIIDNLKNPILVSNLEGAKKVQQFPKIGLVSQTTQSHRLFNQIKAELQKHCQELKAIDTICDATNSPQQAAANLAKQVDFMVIIGGQASGNTKRLYEICREIVPSIKIETVKELPLEKIQPYQKIGITAGASTPDWLIQEVIDKIKKIG